MPPTRVLDTTGVRFYIVSWDTNQAIQGPLNFKTAKDRCKKLGHTNRPSPDGRYWDAIAFVAIKLLDTPNGWGLCYQPVFRRIPMMPDDPDKIYVSQIVP